MIWQSFVQFSFFFLYISLLSFPLRMHMDHRAIVLGT